MNRNTPPRPPQFAQWLLRRILTDKKWDTPLGDFEEYYGELARTKGPSAATRWYWKQVLGLIPRRVLNSTYWSAMMLTNYLKTAWRNLWRYRIYSLINILGLAVGMACFILIMIWIQEEISYDRYHPRPDSLYRVCSVYHTPSGDSRVSAPQPAPLAGLLKTEFPEVVRSTLYFTPVLSLVSADKRFSERFAMVDPDFLEMFTLPGFRGDPDTALDDPNSVIIPQRIAERFFGEENPLGRLLFLEGRAMVTVTGVFRDLPANTHHRFTCLCPIQMLAKFGRDLNNWRDVSFKVYVELAESTSATELEEKLKPLIAKIAPGQPITAQLQPVPDIHLRDLNGGGLIVYIYIFLAMGLFTLIIAWINYINLATARASRRFREISMRRILGAGRRQLIRQFMGESLLMACLAMVVALLLVKLALPFFSLLAGKTLAPDVSPLFFLMIGGVTYLTGVITGLYPAFILSSSKPVRTLKGDIAQPGGYRNLRRALVVFQFSLSIILIIGSIVIYRQLSFMRSRNLGYNPDSVFSVQMNRELYKNYSAIRTALLRNPAVLNVTLTNTSLDQLESSVSGNQVHWEGKTSDDQLPTLALMGVGPEFLETFRASMREGRFFDPKRPGDARTAAILNEAAGRAIGWDQPVGRQIEVAGNPLSVIGVIRDFNFRSLHHDVEPMIILLNWGIDVIDVRIRPENKPQTLAAIQQTIRSIIPGYTLDYEFLEDQLDELYGAEQRMAHFSQIMTLLAVFISCLGLLGLAAFTVEVRIKEIGIRRVLGSSTAGVVFLLGRDFSGWIIAANLVAWPAAYLLLSRWLEGFAYRVHLDIWTFALSGLLAFLLAMATVGYQTIKAARTNPVETLRYE
ncbi:MAG: ABC transporter permease [Acidobacteria bacterium]|nr:ABC transporter permease [Acidobacteriota bacterium]